MARLVVEPDAYRAEPVPGFCLEGSAFRHAARVLRVRCGDALCLVDGSGIEYCCVVDCLESRQAFVRIVERRPLAAESNLQVSLYCALLKGEKLDWVLQKATELGVARVVFFESARSVVRAGAEPGRRGERWQRIVAAAAAQCGRAGRCEVVGPLSFPEAVREAARCDAAVILWETCGLPRLSAVLGEHPEAASVAVMVGPEGGFEAAEAACARAAGVVPVSLGNRILRAETAAVVAPALVLAWTCELG